jgi:hypothetical protein
MAIRRPSGFLVSIVLSYLEMTKLLPCAIIVVNINWMIILESQIRVFYCILLDLVCQQFTSEY